MLASPEWLSCVELWNGDAIVCFLWQRSIEDATKSRPAESRRTRDLLNAKRCAVQDREASYVLVLRCLGWQHSLVGAGTMWRVSVCTSIARRTFMWLNWLIVFTSSYMPSYGLVIVKGVLGAIVAYFSVVSITLLEGMRKTTEHSDTDIHLSVSNLMKVFPVRSGDANRSNYTFSFRNNTSK